MLKIVFQILAILGLVIIGIIAFIVPNNPYEIIPAMTVASFDKPLWFCIIFGGGSLYLMILYYIYDKLEIKKIA